MSDENVKSATDFIRAIIRRDRETGQHGGRVHTRFPPEPNGYLHIGHAKSICLNFGIASEFNGLCNLRFDDTNPSREEVEYVESIREDIRWLGFDWGEREYYASDYFEKLYQYAEQLIRLGKAYVDESSPEEMRLSRGTLTDPGQESRYRSRPADESLALFRKMRAGEFADGAMVLRAKIDMRHPNMVMRDPTIYRIKRTRHHRTGDDWCIYPMYDFAHGLSDSIEGITHSICTLEFENNRILYDWFLDVLETQYRPQQIEFARLNLTYTVLSKRKLLDLVEQGDVSGWNDPRMPTISGLRRRGFPPQAIRNFCERIGVAKRDSRIDIALLEYSTREILNQTSARKMAVLQPVKIILDNYPEDRIEEFQIENNPEDSRSGSRAVPFCRELYIEREDFMEDPPRRFFRLAPGQEVRLKNAYLITCHKVMKNDGGDIVELHCSYDPASRGGDAPDGRKVRGTLHWVSARHAVDAEIRLYSHLFTEEDPEGGGKDFRDYLNPDSMVVYSNCKVEAGLAAAEAEDRFQFLRHGYFVADRDDCRPDGLVFNQTLSLRDSWAKIRKR